MCVLTRGGPQLGVVCPRTHPVAPPPGGLIGRPLSVLSQRPRKQREAEASRPGCRPCAEPSPPRSRRPRGPAHVWGAGPVGLPRAWWRHWGEASLRLRPQGARGPVHAGAWARLCRAPAVCGLADPGRVLTCLLCLIFSQTRTRRRLQWSPWIRSLSASVRRGYRRGLSIRGQDAVLPGTLKIDALSGRIHGRGSQAHSRRCQVGAPGGHRAEPPPRPPAASSLGEGVCRPRERSARGLACAAAGVLGARWSRRPVLRLFWWFLRDAVPRAGPAPTAGLRAPSAPRRVTVSSGSPLGPPPARRPPAGSVTRHPLRARGPRGRRGSRGLQRSTFLLVTVKAGVHRSPGAAGDRPTPGRGTFPRSPQGRATGRCCPRLLTPSGCVTPGWAGVAARRGIGREPGRGWPGRLRGWGFGVRLFAVGEGRGRG